MIQDGRLRSSWIQMVNVSTGIMTTSQTNAIHALTYQAMQHRYGVTMTNPHDSKYCNDAILAILTAYKGKTIDDAEYLHMLKDFKTMLQTL